MSRTNQLHNQIFYNSLDIKLLHPVAILLVNRNFNRQQNTIPNKINKTKMSPPCIHLDITVDELDPLPQIRSIIKNVRPQWECSSIQLKTSPKEAARGVLNTMVVCFMDPDLHDAVMFRVYNSNFSEFTNREKEVKNIRLVHDLYGFAPTVLMTILNGFCYEYIHGEVMTPKTVRLEQNWKLIAKQMALLHSTNFIEEEREASKLQAFYTQEISSFPSQLKDPVYNKRLQNELPTADFIISESNEIREHVLSLGSPVVFCHGDSRPENMVWNRKTGYITFVDYETAGFAYQSHEIAYHFWRYTGLENMDFSLFPDRQFQLKWLKVYLETYHQQTKFCSLVTDEDLERLYVQVNNFYLLLMVYSIASMRYFDTMDFLADLPFDLMQMSVSCYEEYCRRKKDILSLQLPS